MGHNEIIGEVIKDQYYIQELIGIGGISTVYRIFDKKRQAHLALKLLNNDLLSDDNKNDRVNAFQNEIFVLSILEHPNIVRFYDSGVFKDNIFLILDYISGFSLKALMDSNRNQTSSIIFINNFLKSVTSALYFAHANNIVHGDIKPSNILFNSNGNIFLTDFGIARYLDASNIKVIGTPKYIAPETILKDPYTPATDVYSLGLILYELLTKAYPFNISTKTSAKDFFEIHLHRNIIPPKKINKKINSRTEAILLRSLAKNPTDRFQSVLDLYDEFYRANQELIEDGNFSKNGSLILSEYSSTGNNVIDNSDNKTYQINNHDLKDFSGKQLDSRNYELLIPLKKDYRYSHQPLTDDNLNLFFGRSDDVNSLVTKLSWYEGGAFLVSGFRGVGKTSLINKVINDFIKYHKNNVFDDFYYETIVIRFNLPNLPSPTQLIYQMLDQLFMKLEENKFFKFLDSQLIKEINIIQEKITSKIEYEISNNKYEKTNASIGLGNLLNLGISYEGNDQLGSKKTRKFNNYLYPNAENDFLRILTKLSKIVFYNSKPFRKRKSHKIKIIYIFDELDKISDISEIDNLLTNFKNIFSSNLANFIFITGKNFYDNWFNENKHPNNKYSGIFSYTHYLPCFWQNSGNFIAQIIDIKNNLYNYYDKETFNSTIRYLTFTSRGIPRLFLLNLDKHIIFINNTPCLVVTRNERREISFYSNFQIWLDNNLNNIIPLNIIRTNVIYDIYLTSTYLILYWLIDSGIFWFPKNQILKILDSSSLFDYFADYLEGLKIDFLLDSLLENEYVEIRDNKYRLTHRRFIELGEKFEIEFLSQNINNGLGERKEDILSLPYSDQNLLDDTQIEMDDTRMGYSNNYDCSIVLNQSNYEINLNSLSNNINNKITINQNSSQGVINIGRDKSNTISINDLTVSRYHAKLFFSKEKIWFITSLNSKNSLQINDEIILERKKLITNDVFIIGRVRFLILIVSEITNSTF